MNFNNGKITFDINEIIYRLSNKWKELKEQYNNAEQQFPMNQFPGASWTPLKRSDAVLHHYPWKINQYYTEDQINDKDQKVADYCRNYMIQRDHLIPLRKISFWIFYIIKIQWLHFGCNESKREIMEDFLVKNFVLVHGNEVFKMFLKDALTEDEYFKLEKENISYIHLYMQFHDDIVKEQLDIDDYLGKENKTYMIGDIISDISYSSLNN